MADELLFNENILLITLGFDLTVKHPHAEVVKGCTMIRASKELSSTCYLMASNSLHLTMMCLQYSPKVVACFCIHLASKWSNYQIQISRDGRPWYTYVDRSVTEELLKELTEEFLHIFDKCSSKLKKAAKRGQINLELHQKKKNTVPHNGQHSHHSHHKEHDHSSQNQWPEISVTQLMPRLESDQRLFEPKIPFPTPPCSQKSILSPEEGYLRNSPKESQEWNKSQPETSPLSQVPIPVFAVSSINSVIPVAAPTGRKPNLLKRRVSDEDNCSQKRHCSASNFEKSAIITEEVSSILQTAVASPELYKPSFNLAVANFSAIFDTKFDEEIKPFAQVFSERTLTYQASMNLPLDIFDNETDRENNLIDPIVNLPTSNFSLMTERKLPQIANPFDSKPTLTLQATSNYLVNSLDSSHGNQDFSIPQVLPEVKQEPESTQISSCKLRIKSENEIRSVKSESPTVEVESLPSTVNFSELLLVPPEENNVKRKDYKKSKKSKKGKKDKKERKQKKKEKERKKEKRRNESNDNENIHNEMQAHLMPIKISIPKEKLNLNIDLPIVSGSKSKSPEKGSLKIRICKNRISTCDTDNSLPVRTVQTPLKLKILMDPRVI
ncbi:uncharacterized protein LOC117181658 isoform X2 [Belonocnema kinseyi]|nr:uncharacterized protein LOC117181658 isoform X2 [Belonocnema kinseyi]